MNVKRISADTNAALPAGTLIMGYSLVGGSDAANAKMYDAATVTGTDILSISSPLGDTRTVMFEESPKKLDTGLSVDMTGTSAVLYVFYQ